jgi:nitroreductase
MYDLEQAVTVRRSTRMFLSDKPVPTDLVSEALDLAMRAPSNSNIQPWHLVLASGPARDRLVEALLKGANAAPPRVPVLPERFAHMRRDLGALVYGSMGIDRDDTGATTRGAAPLGVLPRTSGRHRLHAPRSRRCRCNGRRHVRADPVAGVDGTGPHTSISSGSPFKRWLPRLSKRKPEPPDGGGGRFSAARCQAALSG